MTSFKHTELSASLLKFKEIAFAYIFGSAQDGVVMEGSDLDVAIYLVGKEVSLDLRLQIIKELEKVVPAISNYDLVVLNSANSILAMQALQGKQLFVRDEYRDLFAGFYSLTCRQYEDDIFWMKKQLEYRGYEVQWSD
jgi:predicted nucleotidyltransferase